MSSPHKDADAEHKRWTTLVARTALAGHVLDCRVTERGTVIYTASRWAWSRQFTTLHEVEAWVASVVGEVVG